MPDPKPISGGVIPAVISPRRSREHSIDLAASLELIDFVTERGVDGIALLGSTGEFVHFELEDRARMLDFAIKRSRIPTLVNVSHSTLDGALYLGQQAAQSGVSAVMLMPPYYYKYSQPEIAAFCLRFAEQIAKEVPVYLYNIPRFTNELQFATARDLLGTGLFQGIKDSSRDRDYLHGLLEFRGDRTFHVMPGDERLLPAAKLAGANGTISGMACALPELIVALDRTGGPQIEAYVHEFLGHISRFPAPAGVKEAVALRGVKTGSLAIPLDEEGLRELDAFRGWFTDWLPGVLQACR